MSRMSPKGRPEGEYRSAQHEGSPLVPKGRPEGEYRSAQHEGRPVRARETFEVAVIGGGLVGAAIAFGLRSLGPRLALLDEGDVAYRAARGNFGLIWVQGKGMGLPPYATWTQRSAREWPRLAGELLREAAIDVALAQPGGIHVCVARGELAQRAAALEALQQQDGFRRFEVEILEGRELRQRLPGIGPDVAGGTYCPLDGHCNPLKLLRALHVAVVRAGAAYRADHRVVGITPRRGGFVLDTGRGVVEAGKIVLAAGLSNAVLAPMVGLAAPVRPNKGQVIALERMPRFLALPVATIRQTDEGTVLIGDSQQDRGFDESLGLDVLAVMAARAVQVFPMLAAARVVRAWAALRVMSADGFPIYEQSAAHPGAFVATCHSGVTLAAAHAYALAPAVAAGVLPESFKPYSARRFGVPQAA
jgi:glycine/D-amino acid oxidase-like deaminating enzyme